MHTHTRTCTHTNTHTHTQKECSPKVLHISPGTPCVCARVCVCVCVRARACATGCSEHKLSYKYVCCYACLFCIPQFKFLWACNCGAKLLSLHYNVEVLYELVLQLDGCSSFVCYRMNHSRHICLKPFLTFLAF
jgi:hypothetical protein